MKKIFVLLLGIMLIAGCAPDGAYLGAMYLNADLGPYKVEEFVPMFGLQWDLRSPHNTPANNGASLDRSSGDLSK